MMDVFESMESDLDATWKQNKILNDQLLEATLKHDIERCVLICNDFVNDNSLDEIEKVKWESIDVQENLLKRIKILENDFQRCQKQCTAFELQLQHQKEKINYESSLKNLCETSWISKMEMLETENVSLEFKNVVQTKKMVTNVDAKNAPKAKDVLCVSYEKNVLTPFHDKCLAKYKLNVNSNVRRALFTTPRTAKPKSLDTTPIVTKTSRTNVIFYSNTLVPVKKWVAKPSTLPSVFFSFDAGLGHNLFSVGQFYDGDLEVAFRSKTCYV
ncbi:hypothetical protein Tco_1151934 [Tanacetum coccineum]